MEDNVKVSMSVTTDQKINELNQGYAALEQKLSQKFLQHATQQEVWGLRYNRALGTMAASSLSFGLMQSSVTNLGYALTASAIVGGASCILNKLDELSPLPKGVNLDVAINEYKKQNPQLKHPAMFNNKVRKAARIATSALALGFGVSMGYVLARCPEIPLLKKAQATQTVEAPGR